MICDFLNTGYTQKVRPYRDRPDLVVDIVWYPAKPDAKALPFPTVFNSNLWAGDWWERPDLGPVGYVGKPNWEPEKIAAHGQFPCLTEDEAVNGFVYDPDLECPRRPDGLPFCCTFQLVGKGGGRMGNASGRIVPFGGSRGSGKVKVYAARGGALAGGSSLLWPDLGGGRAGGWAALWTSTGGAYGGGDPDLFPIPPCAFVSGGPTCLTSLFTIWGSDCYQLQESIPGADIWITWSFGIPSGMMEVEWIAGEAGDAIDWYTSLFGCPPSSYAGSISAGSPNLLFSFVGGGVRMRYLFTGAAALPEFRFILH